MLARLAAGILAFALAGCATLPAPEPLPALKGRPAAFELDGRIAVRQAGRSDIARLRWVHRPDGDVWVIASPLGNEVARIESNGAGATLEQAGGAAQHAESFEALAEQVLGVPLTPQMLVEWLHADGTAGTPGGWKVTIEETQQAGAVELARRISATRGDVVVRLVVDEYREIAG